MNLEDIPTPITDLHTDSAVIRCTHRYFVPRLVSVDLERKLTVAREALNLAFDAVTSVTVRSRAEGEILQIAARCAKEALTLTAPKQ